MFTMKLFKKLFSKNESSEVAKLRHDLTFGLERAFLSSERRFCLHTYFGNTEIEVKVMFGCGDINIHSAIRNLYEITSSANIVMPYNSNRPSNKDRDSIISILVEMFKHNINHEKKE